VKPRFLMAWFIVKALHLSCCVTYSKICKSHHLIPRSLNIEYSANSCNVLSIQNQLVYIFITDSYKIIFNIIYADTPFVVFLFFPIIILYLFNMAAQIKKIFIQLFTNCSLTARVFCAAIAKIIDWFI